MSNYPIQPRPENDPRFTIGLLHDLIEVLKRHGYGPLEGHDAVNLQQAMFGFLYGTAAAEPDVPEGMALTRDGRHAVCADGGCYHGWVFYRPPDGKWVTLREASDAEICDAIDALAAKALR